MNKIFLFLTALVYLYLGGWALFFPAGFVDSVGLAITTNVGSGEDDRPAGECAGGEREDPTRVSLLPIHVGVQLLDLLRHRREDAERHDRSWVGWLVRGWVRSFTAARNPTRPPLSSHTHTRL